jgi:hypothetical protein
MFTKKISTRVQLAVARSPLTASESILEDLLEAQELEDGQVDRRVKTETTLVWAKSGVELHTVALVDLALALVILPDHAELDDALGDRDDLESLLVFGVLFEQAGVLEGGNELCKQ